MCACNHESGLHHGWSGTPVPQISNAPKNEAKPTKNQEKTRKTKEKQQKPSENQEKILPLKNCQTPLKINENAILEGRKNRGRFWDLAI